MPKLRHLGHWSEVASFSQPTPRHFLFVGGSSAMVSGADVDGCEQGQESAVVMERLHVQFSGSAFSLFEGRPTETGSRGSTALQRVSPEGGVPTCNVGVLAQVDRGILVNNFVHLGKRRRVLWHLQRPETF